MQGTSFVILLCRIILVGKLTPSSEKWERIICGGGGKVVVTKSRLSIEVRSLVESDKGEPGLRLCVLPDDFKKNQLLEYASQWGYACVPSTYVCTDCNELHLVTRFIK